MDQGSPKNVSPKKSEMIVISPQELAQLGLLKKLPWKAPPVINSDTSSTSSSSIQKRTVDTTSNSASSSKPLVLNHVLKMTSPMPAIHIKRHVPNKQLPSQTSIETASSSTLTTSREVLNSDISFKKKAFIIAKKSSVLSKEASYIKNILLSTVQTSKQNKIDFHIVENSSISGIKCTNTIKNKTKTIVNPTEVKKDIAAIKDVLLGTSKSNKNEIESATTSENSTKSVIINCGEEIEITAENSKEPREKEVKILSNTTIKLSTDELKQLVSPKVTKLEKKITIPQSVLIPSEVHTTTVSNKIN